MNVKKGEVVLTKSQAKRAGKRMRGKRDEREVTSCLLNQGKIQAVSSRA